jgi:hypothetical protein
MTRVAELRLACSVESWRNLGFAITTDHGSSLVRVAGLDLRFDQAPTVDIGWTLVGDSTSDDSVDGIDTRWVTETRERDVVSNTIDIVAIDHIVIMTGDLERTSRAIDERMGLPRKKVRDAGGGVRQGFHRAGDIILEVVERPDLPTAQPASIWGLVLVVDDIDATIAWLGPDAVGSPRDAVQPGRRIASLRREVGLGLAVALMTPHVR